jgi:hypothetical protein
MFTFACDIGSAQQISRSSDRHLTAVATVDGRHPAALADFPMACLAWVRRNSLNGAPDQPNGALRRHGDLAQGQYLAGPVACLRTITVSRVAMVVV